MTTEIADPAAAPQRRRSKRWRVTRTQVDLPLGAPTHVDVVLGGDEARPTRLFTQPMANPAVLSTGECS